jgi:plastocyanin
MTWRLPIFFSVFSVLSCILATGLTGATVTGRIELTGTRVKDLSGVVVALDPLLPPSQHPHAHAAMKQKDKTFQPHILAVESGTTVDFPNQDPIFHNAFSSFDGKIFDVGLYPPGTSRSVRFDREGIVRVFCNIHSAMSAVIVVLNHPWFATTTHDGAFQIHNVPEGDYTLRVYHERATTATLAALTHPVYVRQERTELPPISISETGYLPAPHKNKFGKEYPHPTIYSEHLR